MQTELLVIGAGPGGYVAALRAAQLGLQVTLVSAGPLGGVCLNEGCIPSKALIDAGNSAERMRREGERGIIAGPVRVEMDRLQAWKDRVVQRLSGGVAQLLAAREVQVLRGRCRLTSPTSALVEGVGGAQTIQFRSCILATGATSAALPHLPFDGSWILSSTEALSLQQVPRRLLVVGGGFIGLELGTAYRKLGAEVTVVEVLDRLLPGVDPEIVRVLTGSLRRQGIPVMLSTKAVGKVMIDGEPHLRVETNGSIRDLPADCVLVTVGRVPASRGLGLETAGVTVDTRGFVPVDASMRTNLPHIFAIGDLTGQPLLAHKASRQGLVAAEMAAGRPAAMEDVVIPAVIFTDPEIAVAGLTEDEARSRGHEPVVGRFPFAASGRALAQNHSEGMVKLVAERKGGRLLGVHIIGPEAGNLIAEAALALELGATAEELALTVHAHPTLSETLAEAAEAALGRPIHIP